MSHCVGVITGDRMDNEHKQCAMYVVSYHYDTRERKYYWVHSESNFTQGKKFHLNVCPFQSNMY